MFTLRAAPLKTPANVNLLSFRTTVAGISLTPAAGESVNVPLNANLYQADLVRLQSDATLLALSTAVPVGSYTNMVVSLSDPAVTYCIDRKSTRLNSSHSQISYAVFCLKKK